MLIKNGRRLDSVYSIRGGGQTPITYCNARYYTYKAILMPSMQPIKPVHANIIEILVCLRSCAQQLRYEVPTNISHYPDNSRGNGLQLTLTQLVAREDLFEYSYHERFKSYKTLSINT